MSRATVDVDAHRCRPPAQPAVVVCGDGCDPDDLARAVAHRRMPWLARVLETGTARVADGVIPRFTNPSHPSIVTGVPPSVQGHRGNGLFDVASGTEVMTNDPKWLRAALADAGGAVAVVAAKDRLRTRLGHRLHGVCFPAVRAAETTLGENGITDGPAVVGMAVPSVYSAQLSEFVFAAGVQPIERDRRPDAMYLSTTDHVQHPHAPGIGTDAADAAAFYRTKGFRNLKTHSLPWH